MTRERRVRRTGLALAAIVASVLAGPVLADHDAPVVRITSPAEGAVVRDLVAVSGTASPGDGQVFVGFTGHPAVVAGFFEPGRWGVVLDSSRVANGAASVSVRYTDSHGRSAFAILPLVLNNPTTMDPYVTSLSSTPSIGGSRVQVGLGNAGNTRVAFDLALEVQDVSGWVTAGVARVAVGGFKTTTTTLQLNTPFLVGDFPARATADPSDVVLELDESNNSASGTVTVTLGGFAGRDVRKV